ncbi:transmembrane protein, putative (macronuclear) [Tetrahymena thermophila SB210]|uniref:Transmembrane protein, putative n=1 Tax=Tetrahymena thermophila (strain SB210) TaxID=312017 RepID=I7M099_TETTS|nr:transmembrane protein, putative [Tetrahymena thermophila SB210]EAR86033.2 transmembrane protein, putative [Tetrahymena thermophila SB210]|eukprot:XP_976628.2 transmembrane protein, putative [Tetrahymena thermophila SB210]
MDYIKKFDLFSLPFQFRLMGKAQKKNTILGGLISLGVIIVSISYFCYLCVLYFGNHLQPSISSTLQYFSEEFQMQFDRNLIAFKLVLSNGMLIQDFERSRQKTYVTILPVLSTKDQTGKEIYQNLNFIQCEDPDLKDYYCVDYSNITKDNMNEPFLNYYPYDNEKQKLEVLVLYCTPNLSYPDTVCATREETQKEIINFSTQTYVRITSQQYNPNTRKYEKKIKQEQFYLSDSLVFLGKFSLKSTKTTVNDGFIIQKEDSKTYISDFQKTNEYNTFAYMQAQLQLDMIGACYFYLDENGRNEFVQFVQFPSVLAQFVSIFNSLLVAGIICKEFSQSEIIQDFMEIQLKNYYKKSAIEFMREVETKKQSNSVSIYFQNNLINTYKQIRSMNYKYYMQKFLDTSLFNKIKLLIFSQGGKTKKNDPKQIKIYKKLMDSTIEQINIYDIQKELLKLKMMVRMSFTVEQYAALQLCGLRIILDENIPNIDDTVQEAINLNEDPFKSSIEEVKKQKQETSEKSSEKQECIDQNKKIIQHNQKSDDYLTEKIGNEQKQTIYLEENNSNQKQLQQNTKIELEENMLKLDENNNKKFQKLNFQSITLNHLEKIERLERDNNYFEQKLDKFFSQKNFKTQLDQRILNCLINYKQHQLDTQSLIPINKSNTNHQ